MLRVLVVAEHASMTEPVVHTLRRKGYDADVVDTGTEALKKHQKADLVLLDLDLPDIDGLDVCRAIRSVSDTPLISFTRRDTELDRVLALQAGSDDCVVTSCGSPEVMARIEAVMRRARPRPSAPQAISLRPLHIDGRAREIRMDDRAIHVTSKEFELLYTLASHPETVVSRKELMVKVWGDHGAGYSRTLDTHVSSLRGKLGARSWITTVRGVGYRIGHA
ncbi:response regulator transcription factor [Streptomyces sp. SP18CS02]|uniref:response regulator transcription factor n=1 Tax=Streptomyces sp. SP18CS02 TaxID=3002531 RepID=UPI002E7A9F17|nr:response regulator transcription factor [Streptomyces sp. SP18CS02]MEE1753162.1 response regulator transcription factor [Streptomyces sp. SP18CS02]